MEPGRRSSLLALGFGALGVAALHFGGELLRASSPVWGLFVTLWIVLPALTVATAIATHAPDAPASSAIDRLRVRTFAARHALGALLLAPALVVLAPRLHGWERSALPFLLEGGTLDGGAPVRLDELSGLARVLLLVVSPAVCEELFFRGALLSGLRRGLSSFSSALVASLLFAAAHASTASFLPAAVLGLVLAFLVQVSGSVVPAILLHAAYNALRLASASIGEETLGLLAWAAIPGVLLVTWPRRQRSS